MNDVMVMEVMSKLMVGSDDIVACWIFEKTENGQTAKDTFSTKSNSFTFSIGDA